MIEQNIIGSYTELYIEGGGKSWLTQSEPTNYHGFWKRKMLTKTESVDDYREVTDTEKAALEKSDAAWVEPSEELIAQCEAAGAVYNRKTGFFELNGLVDLTADDMRMILNFGIIGLWSYGAGSLEKPSLKHIRTNVLPYCSQDLLRAQSTLDHVLYNNGSIEVAVVGPQISNDYKYIFSPKYIAAAFNSCRRLRKVIGTINLDLLEIKAGVPFKLCDALEEIHFHRLKSNLDLQCLSAINYDSLKELIDFAINTEPISVTLHPDAYARLTEDLIAAATEKQITFLTTE